MGYAHECGQRSQMLSTALGDFFRQPFIIQFGANISFLMGPPFSVIGATQCATADAERLIAEHAIARCHKDLDAFGFCPGIFGPPYFPPAATRSRVRGSRRLGFSQARQSLHGYEEFPSLKA